MVRALAGLARADSDTGPYDEARTRFTTRTEFDYSWMWQCDEATVARDLENAARQLGQPPPS